MNGKPGEDAEDVQAFLQKNMPTLRELAPEEFDELLGVYGKIRDKYTERAASLLSEKGLPKDAIELAGPGVAIVAAVIGGVIVAQYYDKATGGAKTKSAQKAG